MQTIRSADIGPTIRESWPDDINGSDPILPDIASSHPDDTMTSHKRNPDIRNASERRWLQQHVHFWNERIVTETRRPTEEILRSVLPQSLATHTEQN